MPTDLLGRIHSSTDTTSPDWATFRGEVTGTYLLSGQGGEWDSQHLIREYNRNINSLYKSWTPTEPNATGLFLEPYNAGFSYQGTGDFRDYKWDTYSLQYDGVDEYVNCGTGLGDFLGDNYAGSLTVSLWFKTDVTSGNDGIFVLGDFSSSNGEFLIFLSANILRFWLNNNGWQREVAFTDTSGWHHLVCVYATGSEANSKMYLDGVAVGATTGSFPASSKMDFAGLKTIIGAYWDTGYPFDGTLDEVAVFTSALSAVQIRAIYNGGTPESLTPYSPVSWWRMGDGPLDNGSDKIIGDQMNLTLGSELLTNGDFSDASVPDTWNGSAPVNLVGWTSGGSAYTAAAHFVITDGKCRLISDGTNIILNGGTCVVGKTYEYSLEVTDVTAGGLTPIGGGVVLEANITSVGTYTGVFTAAATTAMAINRQAGTTDITFGNVSVKEFNGNVGRMTNMEAADIVAEAPISDKWDVYSVIFDGVDEYVDTNSVDDTQASKSYSFWAKSTETGPNGIFDHGSHQRGAFEFNDNAERPMLYMGTGGKYRYWAATSSQSDGAWHHWVLYISPTDMEDCKLYCDGVVQTTNATSNAGVYYTYQDIRIGYGGLGMFNGNLDEFAIFDGELTSAQINTIFNGGVPADLSSLSPDAWWRMGDGDYYRVLHDAAATDANALYLAGIANNYASIPDAADLDGFTDFTLEATVALDDWTSENYLMAKTVSSSVGWFILMRATGVIRFYFSSNGSSWLGPYDSTAATGITDGTSAQIRLVRDGTTLRFYVDGLQLGDNVTISDATIHNSTAVVELGVREASLLPLTGKISRARIWSDATQTTNVLDVNFALQTKGAPSFTATSGQTVTIHTTAIANPAVIRGATDGVIVNDAALRVDTP